jgi:predicted transport protein
MKLFQLSDQKIQSIALHPFQFEREIQNIVEKNADVLFNLELIRSEFSIQNFRLDSLCFDREKSAFVIIEYKKGTNYSVIDQGYTYLSLLLNNKADFILEYNESLNKTIKRDEIDWSQSRVIFISPQFSEYQKNSINFKNIPFELWEIHRYQKELIVFNKIHIQSKENINTTSNTSASESIVQQVSKEIILYDENYHLYKNKDRPPFVIELYFALKEGIMQMSSDIELRCTKLTIGFKQNRVFTDIIIYNKGVGVVLNIKHGHMRDPLGLAEDLSSKGHWGTGDYRIWLKSTEHLLYALDLIKQSYQQQLEQS